jgi:hypothetical protein
MTYWATKQQQVKEFFFAEEVPFGFALMRIALTLVLLQGVLARWPYCIELYSTAGTPCSLIENYEYTNFLPPLSPFWTGCCISMLVVFLISACVGFCTRVSLIGVLVLHTFFAVNDLTSSITKFTVIATHVLLLLAVSECGRVWSVDSWLASRRDSMRIWDSERPAWALAPVWPQRLLMFLIGAIYLGAAITKLHMPEFLTGQAMAYWIMSNPNYRHFIGEWLSQSPSFLSASAHFTVFWELLFLFTAWRGIPRAIMFGLGLFFHSMSAFTLGEVIFLMVMSSTYLGCLSEQETLFFKRLLSWMIAPFTRRISLAKFDLAAWLPARLTQATPKIQLTRFLCALSAFGLLAGWSIASGDHFGLKRPEGMFSLKELPQEEVAQLFKRFEPIREVDKFLAVDVGSVVVANRLADRKTQFRYEDILICETSLNPPHDDMYIECNLVGNDQKVINRVGNIVPRESSFAHFRYRLTDALEPGSYFLVIKSRNQEICRREFSVGKGLAGPVAN